VTKSRIQEGNDKHTQNVVEKPEGNIQLARLRHTFEVNIKMDVK
jgi:hypothetical protein